MGSRSRPADIGVASKVRDELLVWTSTTSGKFIATVAATNQGQTTPWKRFLATFTPEVQEKGERSAIAFVKQASEAYQALPKEEREALVDEEVDELEDDATGNDPLKQ